MVYEETIRKLTLENALKFKGKANPKAILGGVIKEHPNAKSQMRDVLTTIATLVKEINSLSLLQQKEELLKLDPHFESKQREKKQQRKEQRSRLPELPNAKQGHVVTRIPPEPSKYNHLGHALSFLINYLYAKKYDGKAILRFDDTNPEKETAEFVAAVHDDVIDYLGIKPDSIIFASDHMEKYYAYAQQLIDSGDAYVCACAREDISKNRKEMKDCSHRNQKVSENQALWDIMKEGLVKEGSHVLRLKIDMKHKNAVMRDPVIYRMCFTPHYRQGEAYKVWPMYDFESAIEEGLCGVTHVMRSNEFDQRIELQDYIAKLFDFPMVTYKHYGRYEVPGTTTQGREIRALIESGNYLGWDDPRLVTLRALKRRGIVKEAYYELAQKIGLSKTKTLLDFSVIAAVNRSLLDVSAKRFFAVRDPVKVHVKNIPSTIKQFNLAYHPDGKKGERVLSVTENYYLERADNDSTKKGDIIRFMDSMNVKKISDMEYEFVSESYADFRSCKQKGSIIHFVPIDGNELKAEILLPDISIQTIICESNMSILKPDMVVQLERYAFVRFDHIKEDGTIHFRYTHD